jgi:hypothetical protein
MSKTRSLRAEALTSALTLALAIFLTLVAGSTRVTAQSAILHVLVQSSSGRCLALERGPRQRAPALGQRLVVEACDGSRAQRWEHQLGDFQSRRSFSFDEYRCVGLRQGTTDQLELIACASQRRRLESEGNRMDGTNLTFELAGRCMTEPAPNAPPWVTLTPCTGAPTQRWRYAHLP